MFVVRRNIPLVLAVAAVMRIAASTPELDLTVGFSDRFRSGTVTPVTVVVRGGDGPFSGDLTVESVAGTSLQKGALYSERRPVSLSDGISGVYRFSLPLEVSSYPLTARLERHGFLAASASKELRPLNTEKPIVVCLSRRPSLDSLIPALAGSFGRPVELTYPRSEFLPANALAWDGAEMVLWHDFSPDLLDGDSGRALSSWVSGGGTLVVVSGPWLAGREMPGGLPPGRIAPPVPSGRWLLFPPAGEPVGGRSPSSVPPEAVEYPFGRGRVVYVPWDAASSDYPAGEREAFWTRTLGAAGRESADAFTDLERIIIDAAFSDEEPLLPAPTVPLAVLFLFGAAAAGILFIGRSSESAKLRAYRLAALAVLSGAVSAWAALEPRSLPARNLNVVYAWSTGNSRTLEVSRYASSVASEIDVVLDGDGIPYPVPGGEIRIAGAAGERILEGLALEPWAATDVVVRGTEEGRRDEESAASAPGGYRHNGTEPWFDIVGIDGEGAAALAERLDPGEVLVVDSEPADIGADAFGDGDYSRIVEGVAKAYRSGLLKGKGTVLARTEQDRSGSFRLIVLGGDL